MSSIDGGGPRVASHPAPAVADAAAAPAAAGSDGAAVAGRAVSALHPHIPRRLPRSRGAPSLFRRIVQSLRRPSVVKVAVDAPPHRRRLAATLNPLLPMRFSRDKFIRGLAAASVGGGLDAPFADDKKYRIALKDTLANFSLSELRRVERRLNDSGMSSLISALDGRGARGVRPDDCAGRPDVHGEAALQMSARLRETRAAVRSAVESRGESPARLAPADKNDARAVRRAEATAARLLKESDRGSFSHGRREITEDTFARHPEGARLFRDMVNFEWGFSRARLPDGSESLVTSLFAKDFLRMDKAFFAADGSRVEFLTAAERAEITAGADSPNSNPRKVEILENALLRFTGGDSELAWRASNLLVQTTLMSAVNPMLALQDGFGPVPRDLVASTSLTPETADKFVFGIIPGQGGGGDEDRSAGSGEWSDGPAYSLRLNGDGTFTARLSFATRPTGLVANGTTVFPLDAGRSFLHSAFELDVSGSGAARLRNAANSWRLSWRGEGE
ncbi:MAG: hypothetical protein MPJ82_00645 [Alphaproteobacteria bacterium]|nr:hypothetical protein [Alphaproteobacteria bacterium]